MRRDAHRIYKSCLKRYDTGIQIYISLLCLHLSSSLKKANQFYMPSQVAGQEIPVGAHRSEEMWEMHQAAELPARAAGASAPCTRARGLVSNVHSLSRKSWKSFGNSCGTSAPFDPFPSEAVSRHSSLEFFSAWWSDDRAVTGDQNTGGGEHVRWSHREFEWGRPSVRFSKSVT